MKCYYAHPLTDYNTFRELLDVKTLRRLGFEVLNPNAPEHDAGYKVHGMTYFEELVDSCDVLAFRAFIDGKIPAGVVKEVERAEKYGKPTFELPAPRFDRVLTVEETRARLKELGRK